MTFIATPFWDPGKGKLGGRCEDLPVNDDDYDICVFTNGLKSKSTVVVTQW